MHLWVQKIDRGEREMSRRHNLQRVHVLFVLLAVGSFGVFFLFFGLVRNRVTVEEVGLSSRAKVLATDADKVVVVVEQDQKPVTSSCAGRWIFIHDLPDVYNRAFVSDCAGFKKNVNLCPYLQNGGMGLPLEAVPDSYPILTNGSERLWFNTWQFGLELYFHERLLRYDCRTFEEEAANAFYVPFYVGMDFSFRTTHRLPKDVLYLQLLDWLKANIFFNRNGGLDHFLTLGRIARDFRRPKESAWGTQMLFHPDFRNMVKFTVEGAASNQLQSAFRNEVAVPYPTYFHPSKELHMKQLVEWASQLSQRSFLVSMAAGTRRGQTGTAAKLRKRLMNECEGDSGCMLLVCEGNENIQDFEHKASTRTAAIVSNVLHASCHDPITVINMFHKSQFCLQPPGDSPTRRSLFDSMLAGCIPVVFSKLSTQYPTFLPDGETYSVLLPARTLPTDKSVIDMLKDIPQQKITSMQAKIGELLPIIVYASVGTSSNLYNVHHSTTYEIEPKLPTVMAKYPLLRADAFDLAIDEMFSHIKQNLA